MRQYKELAEMLKYSVSSLDKITRPNTQVNLRNKLAYASLMFLLSATDKERQKFLKFFEFDEVRKGRVTGFKPNKNKE